MSGNDPTELHPAPRIYLNASMAASTLQEPSHAEPVNQGPVPVEEAPTLLSYVVSF